MVYVGVLPYSINEKGNIVFLLGKERYEKDWNDSLLWSGFGGKLEDTDESIIHGIAREAYEESMGFLGSFKDLYNYIINNPIYIINENTCTYKKLPILENNIIPIKTKVNYDTNLRRSNHSCYNFKHLRFKSFTAKSYISPMKINYDTTYINLYENIYKYMEDSDVLKLPYKNGFFEKISLTWVSVDDILSDRKKYRPAFVDSLKKILGSKCGPIY
jgi:hypothetical protein